MYGLIPFFVFSALNMILIITNIIWNYANGLSDNYYFAAAWMACFIYCILCAMGIIREKKK